jgi:two-component system phosphate regulon response regulator PhoB
MAKPNSTPSVGTDVAATLVLTPTEQRLLDSLRAKPGEALSRAELMTAAMPGTIVLARTIDVHIRALRKKLGPAARRLRTVRKVGYTWAK